MLKARNNAEERHNDLKSRFESNNCFVHVNWGHGSLLQVDHFKIFNVIFKTVSDAINSSDFGCLVDLHTEKLQCLITKFLINFEAKKVKKKHDRCFIVFLEHFFHCLS